MLPYVRFRFPKSKVARWCSLAAVVVTAGMFAPGIARRGDVERGGGLAAGAAFVDSLLERTASVALPRDLSFGDAVALGYLDRLRLGLGSPFRLAEYALRDPRLDSTSRRLVAWAIIGRTLRAEGYRIEPPAVAAVSPVQPDESLGVAVRRWRRHLALIEATVAQSRDPRAGELAVRIAYSLAVAERSVDRGAVAAVAPVAALIRDRKTAMSDARRLLREARTAGSDPFVVLGAWRRERRFGVERPSAELLDEAVDAEAMAHVRGLLDAIRAADSMALHDTSDVGPAGDGDSNSGPALRAASAERLASGVAGYAPPQAPIVTAVRHNAGSLLAAQGVRAGIRSRRHFVDRAVNEETFTAEIAHLAAREQGVAVAARLAVAAAAALRAYAQEAPWFPGDPSPTADDLRREFGIASIRFDDAVPSWWRPYYRRMLADGLRDLRRVLPAVSLAGARIRFRSGALGGATLAMHDPRTRTIHLPIATWAGTLAHEVAHDLDWQMGRQRYSRRGSYGTDVVVREQRGRLAASLRGLSSGNLVPPAGPTAARPPDDARPAEVFARTMDWFVSVALAREGRMNGYLSAVQDEVLTGHVAVLPRDAGGWSAQALANVLEETTLVGAPLREWLLAEWGPARVRRPYALTREVLTAPVARRGEAARPSDGWISVRCIRSTSAAPSRSRLGLAQLAAEARARGALRGRAQRYPAESRPAWAESVLGNAPWSPQLADDAVRRLARVFLRRVEESGAAAAALDWGDYSARGRSGRQSHTAGSLTDAEDADCAE